MACAAANVSLPRRFEHLPLGLFKTQMKPKCQASEKRGKQRAMFPLSLLVTTELA